MHTAVTLILQSTDIGDCLGITEDFMQNETTILKKTICYYQQTLDTFEQIGTLELETLKYACISRIFVSIFLSDPQNGTDYKRFSILELDDITRYKNKPFIQNKAWKMLRRECIYNLEIEPGYKNEKINVDNWLFDASKSPIWMRRITKYGGKIGNSAVIFEDEDMEEEFRIWFDVDPDEQPTSVKDKWIGQKKYEQWSDIHICYACEPYNEWLNV